MSRNGATNFVEELDEKSSPTFITELFPTRKYHDSALDVRGNNKPMSRHLSVVCFFPDAW